MLYAVLVAALVAIDQVVKYLVRANIPLGESIPFPAPCDGPDPTYRIPGRPFPCSRSTPGCSPCSLWPASVLLTLVLVKGWVTRTRMGRLCVAVVLAGAVGNLIDRALFRFVTDMFETTFINFAVFNVADICVVLGASASVPTISSSMRSWRERRAAMTTLELRADRTGERADSFLARTVEDLTRSAAQRLLEEGAVREKRRLREKEREAHRRGYADPLPPGARAGGHPAPGHSAGRGV